MKQLLIAILMMMLLLSACQPPISTTPNNDYCFTGKVVEIYESSCLMEVTDSGGAYLQIGQQVIVATNISDCPRFTTGDSLTVYFDGKIAYSLPPQILGVRCIKRN